MDKFRYDIMFQTKIISSMFVDNVFFLMSIDSLKTEYFTSEGLRWIFLTIKKYYGEYKKLPTMLVLSTELKKLENESLRVLIAETLPKIVTYLTASDLNYIKDETKFFCKEQAVKMAFLDGSKEITNASTFLDFDKIKRNLDSAFMTGEDTSGGYEYKTDVSDRYTEAQRRKPIATGFEPIDKYCLSGGLGPGEVGVILAGSGIGKSWLLTLIGLHAVKLGKTVLHYTFELDETYTSKRYDVCLLRMDKNVIEENIDLLEQETKNLKGKLFIKHFPARSITLTGLKANIEKNVMLGIKPDIIILDYADLINTGSYSKEKRSALEDLYIDVRAMADELRIPIWTASQSNREGYKSDVAKGENVSESFGKLFTSDFVMSFNRGEKDKLNKSGKLHIIKTRFGTDGNTFVCDVDLDIGQIDVYDKNSERGQEISLSLGDMDLNNLKTDFNNFKNSSMRVKQTIGAGEF